MKKKIEGKRKEEVNEHTGDLAGGPAALRIASSWKAANLPNLIINNTFKITNNIIHTKRCFIDSTKLSCG